MLKYICVQNLGFQIICSHAVWQYSQSASSTPLTFRWNIHQPSKHMRLHCITLFPLSFHRGLRHFWASSSPPALCPSTWFLAYISLLFSRRLARVKRCGEGRGHQEGGLRDEVLFLCLYSFSMVFLRRRAARVTITSISPSAPLLCVEWDTSTSSSC